MERKHAPPRAGKPNCEGMAPRMGPTCISHGVVLGEPDRSLYTGAMARWTDEPLDEREFPDEDDLGEDDDVLGSIEPCPNCGCGVWDEADRCNQCGEWIAHRRSWRSSRKWYVRGGLWASRTLLVNWLFWIAMSAMSAIAAIRWWMDKR